MTPTFRFVVRVDRSPMNAKRWCLTLVCAHEVWITKARRPKAAGQVRCGKCEVLLSGEGTRR